MARGRRPLRRGEAGPTAWTVRAPGSKMWVSLDGKPPAGATVRAQAYLGLRDGSRLMRVQGRTKAIAATNLEARLNELRRQDGAVGATKDLLGDRIRAYIVDVKEGRVARVRAQRSKTTYISIADTWCLSAQYTVGRTTRTGHSTIDKMKMLDLMPGDLNREAVRIAEEGGASQLKHIRAIWNAVCQRAVDDGAILHNPVRDMAPLPTPDRQKPRVYSNGAAHRKNDVLTDEDAGRLLETAYANTWDRKTGLADMMALSLMTGMRIAELASLRWQDVDLDVNPPVVMVTGKLVRRTGAGLVWEDFLKTDVSQRVIPLPPEAVLLMKRRAAAVKALGSEATEADRIYIIPSRTHSTPDPDNVNRRVRKAFDRSGLPHATNHTIRRTVENRLRLAGVARPTSKR